MGLPPTQAYTPFAESRVLERAVAAFEDAWLAGRPPTLDAFLDELPDELRSGVLREIVYIDLERRLGAGESLRAEHYLTRYPDLIRNNEDLLALIQWEFRLRKLHEPELACDEYRARFPHLDPDLSVWLARACCDAATIATPSMPRAFSAGGSVPGYRILAQLGRGGMGVVYKARQLATNRVVALKVIRGELMSHPGAQRRFAREIQASMRLDHQHIVRVHDGAVADETCFLVMEYLEGDTLSHVVNHNGRLAVWEACELIRQAALGLHHAHVSGLVHRDIKPSNLLVVGRTGEEGVAGTLKILDLGLVRIDSPDAESLLDTLTQQGVLMGTIDFIAPEQALNPHNADSRADLYSLGCTFYYLLLGRVPFPVGTMVEKLDKHRWASPRPADKLRTEVPRVVAEVVERLLAKDPADRYQTAAEVAEALAPLCTAAGCAAARVAQAAAQLTRTPIPSSSVLMRPAPREPIGVLRRLTGHTDAVCGVAVTADGSQIITASRDRSLRVWDVAGAKPTRQLYGHMGEVRCVAVSAASKRILSGGSDRSVRVWDLPSGRLVSTLAGHTDAVKSVAFSPDGLSALSAGNDRRLVLWDLSLGRKIRSLKGHTGDPNCVAFAPNGSLAVSGGWDKTLRVWELPSGKELRVLGGTYSDFQWSVFMGIAFHPDGRLIVGSSDHTVCLLDVETGRVTQRFEGHANWVSSVAVSPDGRHLLSGGWDGTVRLWNVAKGRLSACFESHTDQVQSVCFAPDGVHAFSVSTDRSVVYWRVLP